MTPVRGTVRKPGIESSGSIWLGSYKNFQRMTNGKKLIIVMGAHATHCLLIKEVCLMPTDGGCGKMCPCQVGSQFGLFFFLPNQKTGNTTNWNPAQKPNFK